MVLGCSKPSRSSKVSHNQRVSLKNWIVPADFDPDEVLLNSGDGNLGDGNINGHAGQDPIDWRYRFHSYFWPIF